VPTRGFCNSFHAASSLEVVKQHQAEFNAHGFTCWEQFVANQLEKKLLIM